MVVPVYDITITARRLVPSKLGYGYCELLGGSLDEAGTTVLYSHAMHYCTVPHKQRHSRQLRLSYVAQTNNVAKARVT